MYAFGNTPAFCQQVNVRKRGRGMRSYHARDVAVEPALIEHEFSLKPIFNVLVEFGNDMNPAQPWATV